MKLSFCTLDGTVQIEITHEQFKRLRDHSITLKEIKELAMLYGIKEKLLLDYVNDIKMSQKEVEELDGSCDYSDHM